MRTQRYRWPQRVFAAGVPVLFLVAACVAVSGSATAQPSPAERAARVPIDVVEVVSGSNWERGSARGFWRVVTIMVPSTPPANSPHCEVFMQWIGSRTPGAPFEILAASPLVAFNALQLPSASVGLDIEGNREPRVAVTGEDRDGVLTILTFVVQSPGEVVFVPADDTMATLNGRSGGATTAP